MGVNEVGKMIEVGGEVMEVDEVGDEVPQVGATGVGGATGGGASSSTDMSVDPVGPVFNNLNLSLRTEADPLSGIGTVTRPAEEDEMSVDEIFRLVGVWVNEK